MLMLRVGVKNSDGDMAPDKAIADAYGNHFKIPLDFELLESRMPFLQSVFGDRLKYELTFNECTWVI